MARPYAAILRFLRLGKVLYQTPRASTNSASLSTSEENGRAISSGLLEANFEPHGFHFQYGLGITFGVVDGMMRVLCLS